MRVEVFPGPAGQSLLSVQVDGPEMTKALGALPAWPFLLELRPSPFRSDCLLSPWGYWLSLSEVLLQPLSCEVLRQVIEHFARIYRASLEAKLSPGLHWDPEGIFFPLEPRKDGKLGLDLGQAKFVLEGGTDHAEAFFSKIVELYFLNREGPLTEESERWLLARDEPWPRLIEVILGDGDQAAQTPPGEGEASMGERAVFSSRKEKAWGRPTIWDPGRSGPSLEEEPPDPEVVFAGSSGGALFPYREAVRAEETKEEEKGAGTAETNALSLLDFPDEEVWKPRPDRAEPLPQDETQGEEARETDESAPWDDELSESLWGPKTREAGASDDACEDTDDAANLSPGRPSRGISFKTAAKRVPTHVLPPVLPLACLTDQAPGKGPLERGRLFWIEGAVVLGSSPELADFLIRDPGVLPEHCLIRAQGKGYSIQQLGVTGSVRLNGADLPPREEVELPDQCVLEVAATKLYFFMDSLEHVA